MDDELFKVKINVYDLSSNDLMYSMGLGLYHSGVEIRKTGNNFSFILEYCYGRSKLFIIKNRTIWYSFT
jgi:hypothetical protein